MYLVIHNDTRKAHHEGYEPWGDVISRHRTLSGAQREYRRRNPHLFNRRWAEAHGYANAGTFDEIVEVNADGLFVATCSTRESDDE